MKVTLYHNPRCSKSREALHLIRDQNIEPEIIEYLQTPPSADELKQLLKMLKIPTREMLRSKEPIYKQLDLDNPKFTDEQLIQAIVKNPILLERPIVIAGKKAVIARPAELVLEIL